MRNNLPSPLVGEGSAFGAGVCSCNTNSRLEILAARPGLAVVDGVLEELIRIVSPELTDIRIGLDHRVDELAAFPLDLADVDVADHVAVFVEAHLPAHGLDLVACTQRRHKCVL